MVGSATEPVQSVNLRAQLGCSRSSRQGGRSKADRASSRVPVALLWRTGACLSSSPGLDVVKRLRHTLTFSGFSFGGFLTPTRTSGRWSGPIFATLRTKLHQWFKCGLNGLDLDGQCVTSPVRSAQTPQHNVIPVYCRSVSTCTVRRSELCWAMFCNSSCLVRCLCGLDRWSSRPLLPKAHI